MDELIDAEALAGLRRRLTEASGRGFDELGRAATRVDGMKLRSRVDVVAAALVDDLPDTYGDAAALVRSALDDPDFAGWTIWPVGEAMARLALASDRADDFDDGLVLLADLTPRLSSEFAIRGFLARDLDRSLDVIATWTDHPDPHVRRLASEGTRPYLPWAVRVKAIIDRPDCTIRLLDALYRDDDEVVRRSVANHLNDLSRHAPDLLIETATRWCSNPDVTTDRVVRQGLRTLVKRGDHRALALLGFGPAAIEVGDLRVSPPHVFLPGEVELSFAVTNVGDAATELAIDYVIHFRKKNGSLAPKVFKLATRRLAVGETATISKRHALRQMTTRVHHAGRHELELQINGERYGRAEFDVTV